MVDVVEILVPTSPTVVEVLVPWEPAVLPVITLTENSVLEDALLGTTIGTFDLVNATGTPTFRLIDDAGGQFVVDGDDLKTAELFDYEAVTSYTILVTADGTSPTITQTFIITVLDVADSPVINFSGTTVSEGAEIDDVVGALSISGTIDSGTPTFSLLDSAGGRFGLSSDTLSVVVAGVLDYETATSHSITVSVSGILPTAAIQIFTLGVLSIGPMPIAFSPANGATGVAQTVQPSMTLSAPARRASGYLYLKKVSDDTVVQVWAVTNHGTPHNGPESVEFTGTVDNFAVAGEQFSNTVILHPAANLSGGTAYKLVWDQGVFRSVDDNFNPPFTSTWQFTTGGSPPATIVLSNTIMLSTITNGTLIGDLSVTGGSGIYTYTIPVDGDLDEIFCLTGDDLGNRGAVGAGPHRVTIRATNNVNAPIYQTFVLTVVATDTIPTNSVAPVVSATSAISGDLLTCTTGTWGNRPVSYAYQWMRGGVDIGGATSSSYVVVAADISTTLTCKVRSTNTAGTSAYTTSSNSCAVGTALLLDSYTVGAAYSLRKLRTAYAGSCVRIWRSSDSTQQDFGFVSGVVDLAGIATFVGVGTGVVCTWYDQSGNGVNLTEDISSAPSYTYLFIASGLNGKPVLRGQSSNPGLRSSAIDFSIFSGANQITSMMVKDDDAVAVNLITWYPGGSNIILLQQSTGGNDLIFDFGSGTAGTGGGQVSIARPVGYYSGGHITEMYRTTAGGQGIVVDGTSLVAATGMDDVPATGSTNLIIGNGFIGDLYEVFILKTDIGETARAAVRTNMAGYYGITFPITATTSLRYSGTDANATLESTYGDVPAQFNILHWNKFSSCTNFFNKPIYHEISYGPNIYEAGGSLTHSSYVTGPFGSNNATRLIPGVENSGHYIKYSGAYSLGVKTPAPFRLAVIAKAAGYDRLVLTWEVYTDVAADKLSVGININTGAIGYDNVVGANIVLDAATMTSLGSGWWLCKIDFHYPTASSGPYLLYPKIEVDNGTGTAVRSVSFTGNGTSGVDLFWWHVLPVACWTINWSELFREDFEDLSSIDLDNTKAPGYKFYINNLFPDSAIPSFGWESAPPSIPSNSDNFSIDRPSILKNYCDRLSPSPGWDNQLWTVVDQGGGVTYASFKHKPPLIFERYTDWDSNIGARTANWAGNINLWSVPFEWLDNDLSFTPPGTQAQYLVEWDVVETISDSSSGGIHGWSEPYTAHHYTSAGAQNLASPWPLKNFRRTACIWLRAEDTGTSYGLFLWFSNGRGHGVGQAYGPTVNCVPPPGGAPAIGNFSGADNQHMILISNGTGNGSEIGNPGQPYYVDWLRVYGVAP